MPENEQGTGTDVYECPICGSEVPEDLDEGEKPAEAGEKPQDEEKKEEKE